MFIYKITNTINNKIYIGQTVQHVSSRYSRHKYNAKSGESGALYSAMRKYGIDNFLVEEIDGANSISELNYKEKHYIEYLNSKSPNGYNIKEGGKNARQPESVKEKLRNRKVSRKILDLLDEVRPLALEKQKRPVTFENSKTGEIIEFDSVRATQKMGSSKYINDLLTGKRPYGLYKGYWVYYTSDKNYLEKRKNCKKIELYIKIQVKNTITREIKYFDSKKEAYKTLGISKHFFDKHFESGIPYNNMLIERFINE